MLAGGATTGLSTANDSAVPIGEFTQQIEILVVHVEWSGTLAVDKQRVLFLDFVGRLFFPGRTAKTSLAPTLILLSDGDLSTLMGIRLRPGSKSDIVANRPF